ncbi:hypothetical protein GF386_01155 [Candidatus Pacearchaeota archaeon]|nr:hypothetical protein [Candidatus Pacearchaeota archaeon]
MKKGFLMFLTAMALVLVLPSLVSAGLCIGIHCDSYGYSPFHYYRNYPSYSYSYHHPGHYGGYYNDHYGDYGRVSFGINYYGYRNRYRSPYYGGRGYYGYNYPHYSTGYSGSTPIYKSHFY